MIMIIMVMSLWYEVEGKKARVSRNKKKRGGDMTYGLMFVGALFGLTFIPLIGYFLYNVWKDPLTPTLVKNGTEMFKEKTMGYLSNKRKNMHNTEGKFE